MFVPENEQGVVALFFMQSIGAGWNAIEIGASYPDALIERNGVQWRVEFEYVSSNFVAHKHDPRRCDMIVCWKNDWIDCPLPVVALCEANSISEEYAQVPYHQKEVAYWKDRAMRAERKLRNRNIPEEKAERTITSKDEAIVKLLAFYADNPNASYSEAGEVIERSKSTVKTYLDELQNAGRVHVNGSVQVIG